MVSAQDSEYINLSPIEIRILLALLLGQMNGYEIGRQIEVDAGLDYHVSNGPLYRCLKTLKQAHFIELVDSYARSGAKVTKIYRITATGRAVIKWQTARFQAIITLEHERSRNPWA